MLACHPACHPDRESRFPMSLDADVYSGVNWTGVERAGEGGEQFGNCRGSPFRRE